MSESQDIEGETQRRQYTGPHSGKHPIPTIQSYRQHRKELQQQSQDTEEVQRDAEDESRAKRAYGSAKRIIQGEDQPTSHQDPYPSANRNYAVPPGERKSQEQQDTQHQDAAEHDEPAPKGDSKQEGNQKEEKTATEKAAGALDPKEKRKAMKKAKRKGGGREVTDPVTHLPTVIHDQTEKDLKHAPENEPQPGTDHWTATGPQGASKSRDELEEEKRKLQYGLNGVQKLFPPPDFEDMKQELVSVYRKAVYAGLSIIGGGAALFAIPAVYYSRHSSIFTIIGCASSLAVAVGTAVFMGQWTGKKVTEIFDDELWDSSRREEDAELDSETELPESVQWLNRFLASVWPLINPDLFASLIDTIEDVMQASLPKAIKMVSIDDMAQGNESIRILGVRMLPTGAAAQTVDVHGHILKGGKDAPGNSTNQEDRKEPSQNDGTPKSKQEEQEKSEMKEGLEAEEGDFINIELALAYRSRASGKSIKAKAKNAHLFLKFYLYGGTALPIWVELRGLIATMRLRLQLTPDPPFISLCTMTFLGQPAANMSCVPLSKHNLNLMDLPLISSFVQSSIDAALAEYVAPKSLTLDLKDMLVGEDFKKDTMTRGVVLIHIKSAHDFKQGDGGIGPMQGSSDSYVTVSWGKFGKPVASTRIIEDEQHPVWNEWVTILVTAEELNAEEHLRLQLYDSDKRTADDDLGRVELPLKSLMQNTKTKNQMQDREDDFIGEDPDEKMPGSLVWSVGYFSKTRITQEQLDKQTVNEDIRTKDQLKHHVSEISNRKLREAGRHDHDGELHQQQIQGYKELEDAMIDSSPPPSDFVSGVLSVQIHNITGLEIQKLNKQDKGDGGDSEDEAERHDDMPDSYCNIILNHKKIYRTRTKPKNSKPFFNAGTERFVRDWRDTEVIVSVRDAREAEDAPLIGIVYLPLAKVFADKSQLMDTYPLVGGIGYGRARISMVWRSVDLKLPPNLRGWDYGTLEIRGEIREDGGLPDELKKCRLKIRSNLSSVKMDPGDGKWIHRGKQASENAFLAVRKRYASAVVIEFRESKIGPNSTSAFAVLWLHDLVDEEDETKTLQVWKGGKDNLSRAQSCCQYEGMEEGERPLGEIRISLKFWRGLSGYHKRYAAKAKKGDMRNVMECLDTITDEDLDQDAVEDDVEESEDRSDDEDGDSQAKKRLKMHTNDDSSVASSDDNNNTSRSSSSLSLSGLKKAKKIPRNPIEGVIDTVTSTLAPGENDPEDGSRGVQNQLRDYKQHHKQLHRKHRGVMQWRVARQADHVGGKLSRLKGKVDGVFHHQDKDGGVETEV